MPERYNPHNRYDRNDIVDRVAAIIAGPLKIAAYKVRDPETQEWGALQFHMTMDNTVMCVMGESAAKLFARFVSDTWAPEAAMEFAITSLHRLSDNERRQFREKFTETFCPGCGTKRPDKGRGCQCQNDE